MKVDKCRAPRSGGGAVADLTRIAVDVLHCALSWEPGVRLIGDVTAAEVATLAAHTITQCPKCGAEAWVNIDCDLCMVCSELEKD
jgi:hypothetical protein